MEYQIKAIENVNMPCYQALARIAFNKTISRIDNRFPLQDKISFKQKPPLNKFSRLTENILNDVKNMIQKHTIIETHSFNKVKWEILGKSVQGREIKAAVLGNGNENILFVGVMHGDEFQAEYLLNKFIETIKYRPDLLKNKKVTIIPILNPDGLSIGTRQNANGVDLNRNFITQNWKFNDHPYRYSGRHPGSEPETKILSTLVENLKPSKIITIHAPFHCVNYDGPAKELAHKISFHNEYKVEADIGIPTPGSFGNFAGVERNIPTITLELPDTIPLTKLWETNKQALLSCLE